MAIAPERMGIGIHRQFTTPGQDPYDTVEWERRDARIANYATGAVAFEQGGVEVPAGWSFNATNILAQKYFRGTLGAPEREWSLKQVADRVVDTITRWGQKDGYFVDEEEAETFRAELKYLIIHQRAAFNSPVWFNIGVEGVPQQGSACQPYDSLVNTPDGLIPIGRLVETDAVGTKVYDAHGLTSIVAVKANGRKSVLRLHTKAGLTLDVTADHLVWRASGAGTGRFVPAGQLRVGDQLTWHRTDVADDGAFAGRDDIQAGDVKLLEIERVEDLGETDVYDIQTESGEYLSSNLRVHNCFILAVDDSMDSILQWYTEEGTIFKGGSGAGVNLSKIRSSKEGLRGGGTASGPVSFMRGADASAGTIKSGGKTRRAAKMVILDVGHPDIEDFIWCKAIEERKARALRDAGFDMDLDGKDSHSIQYQNANNSVRVTDEFMQAVLDDADWHMRAITTGDVLETVRARDLFRQIAKAAWECADPGMQFDTTINKWHTAPMTARINGSNPCCFVGETRVITANGSMAIADIARRCDDGMELPRLPSIDLIDEVFVERPVVKAWVAGHTRQIAVVRTSGGGELRCTREHRFLTVSGEWVEARDLQPWTALRSLGGREDVVSVVLVTLDEEVPVFDLEVEGTHNFAVETASGSAVVVHNSEYMHIDNSACNLASLNLLTFMEENGAFDVEGFRAATEVVFTAQEILVGNADYPTEKIAENSRRFRQLGIGYANLGALLMSEGLPYDSDGGRAWASAITALLTGHSYATSARTAARMGPFAGYQENRDAMLSVLRMHRDAVAHIDEDLVPPELLSAAQEAWDTAVETAEQHGVRNSQASVLAPTGTIALLLDCDTTGIEPDLGLVKLKKLVGGGTMSIVNQTVPRALRHLGYSVEQIIDIIGYIDQRKSILGAPYLSAEHLPVFACSMGDNTIHYRGHIRMMAAAQPWISGAISKTVNMPEEATVEEVEQLHIEAWQLGLKAIAIYRDNCKVAQPLATAKRTAADPTASAAEVHDAELAIKVAELENALQRQTVVVKQPIRERLPRRRASSTFAFRVADCEGYVTVGEYEDGRPGEVFMKVSKQGSTLAGIMDAFAIAVSLGLQHGVPLATYVKKYTNMRFEPAGMTDDPELRIAQSLVDYIFRRLAVDYLSLEERAELGVLTSVERTQLTLPGVDEAVTPSSHVVELDGIREHEVQRRPGPVARPAPSVAAESDAPYCFQCGVQMMRSGSCHACPSCGTTSGCS